MADAMTGKLKHLEFIQGVIGRLATASFRMKGWCIVLVSALLVVPGRLGDADASLLASLPVVLLPVLMFWGLDGYYLSKERLFRTLYDHVRQPPQNGNKIDFSMDAHGLPGARNLEGLRGWTGAMFSVSLSPFYGVLAAIAVAVALLT